MLITQVYQRQKGMTLSYRTGHATIANALVKTCLDRRQQLFWFFREYIVIDRK